VQTVLAANRFVGTNVKIVPALFKVTAPGTGTPPDDTETELLPTLATLKGTLVTKPTRTFTGTLFAALVGLTIRTVGAEASVVEPVVKYDPKPDNPWPLTSLMPNVACT